MSRWNWLELWIDEGGTIHLEPAPDGVCAKARDDAGTLCEVLGSQKSAELLDALDEGLVDWLGGMVIESSTESPRPRCEKLPA